MFKAVQLPPSARSRTFEVTPRLTFHPNFPRNHETQRATTRKLIMFLGVQRLVHAAGLLSSPLGLPLLQAQALKQGKLNFSNIKKLENCVLFYDSKVNRKITKT